MRRRAMIAGAALVDSTGRLPLMGSALRWIGNQYAEGSMVTIRSGYAAGYRWVRSHRFVNGYWTGQYELAVQRVIANELVRGATFWDIGANAGFFSLVAARVVGECGCVVAVEPVPANAATIARQFHINGLTHGHVRQAAVADVAGHVRFTLTDNSSTGHLRASDDADDGGLVVEQVTLDALAEAFPLPQLVKVDVEGAEVLVLAGGRRLLTSGHPPRLIIELHGQSKARAVVAILRSLGYAIHDLSNRPTVERSTPHHILAACNRG